MDLITDDCDTLKVKTFQQAQCMLLQEKHVYTINSPLNDIC